MRSLVSIHTQHEGGARRLTQEGGGPRGSGDERKCSTLAGKWADSSPEPRGVPRTSTPQRETSRSSILSSNWLAHSGKASRIGTLGAYGRMPRHHSTVVSAADQEGGRIPIACSLSRGLRVAGPGGILRRVPRPPAPRLARTARGTTSHTPLDRSGACMAARMGRAGAPTRRDRGGGTTRENHHTCPVRLR